MAIVKDRTDRLNIWEDLARLESGTDADQIERRDHLSQKEFQQDYVRANRPVIITDAIQDWPALSKWTPEYLQSRYASLEITTNGKAARFGDVIDSLLKMEPETPAPYVYQSLVGDVSPELAHDLAPAPMYWSPNWLVELLDDRFLPAGLRKMLGKVPELGLKIAGAGSIFPTLHWDALRIQSFSSQVYGRKVWAAYSPDQTRFLYPRKGFPSLSSIPVVHDVDLETFPLFRDAKPIRIVLEPGEMLFMPAGWWHTTRALTPCIAVAAATAGGPIWRGVMREVFAKTIRTRGRYKAPLAGPLYAAYRTAFWAVKAIRTGFGQGMD